MAVARRRLTHETSGHFGEEKAFARLAVMKSGRYLSRNEPGRAWELLHATLRFSRHVSQNAGISRRACGIGIYAMASRGIVSWSGHPKTSAPDIEHAMSVLSWDYATMTQLYSTTLKHEYLVTTDCLDSFEYKGGVFRKSRLLDNAIIFMRGEPEFSESLLRHVLKNQLEAVDNDLATRPAFVARNQWLFDLAASPSRPVSGTGLASLTLPDTMVDLLVGIPRLKHLLAGRDIERCMQVTMLSVLAVECFARQQGQLPESLEECADPDSLSSFPDPYLPGASSLIYKSDGNFAVVYSVGPDGVDDRHSVQPGGDDEQNSWSELRNNDNQFEGYRIPLWKMTPDKAFDEAVRSVPDNVQD